MPIKALRRLVVPVCAAAVVLSGCSPSAEDDVSTRPDPATAIVSASYENGALPPPYHYRWDLTAREGQLSVRWRAGYEQENGPTWVETAPYTTAELRDVLTRLDSEGCLDLNVSSGEAPPGSPYVTEFAVRDGAELWSAAGPADEEDTRAIMSCTDIIQELAPAELWEGLSDRQQRWGEGQ